MKDDRPAEWIAQRMDFVERPKELPIALLCFPLPGGALVAVEPSGARRNLSSPQAIEQHRRTWRND
ncbi:hypothetical protein QA639_34300 [Bradyrhizobium pachyrhizi]|uniref:hypothetical protein n=1 Tax=Bradyrhizobium pachyrhizi TaxID=280333 RepID=UPI0024B18765|nr:hypothetical protein [Bradyrhizobium pachyrhizi]WFU54624.1 hypothetical protein QA639_34300 [Bradyrhizobium pachyrhizi]